jgi:hypothetical protein
MDMQDLMFFTSARTRICRNQGAESEREASYPALTDLGGSKWHLFLVALVERRFPNRQRLALHADIRGQGISRYRGGAPASQLF